MIKNRKGYLEKARCLRYEWKENLPTMEDVKKEGLIPFEIGLFDSSVKIPEGVVVITSRGNYKVRVSWFHQIYSTFALAKLKGLVSEDLIQKYEKFREYMEVDFKKHPLTNQEDIRRGNVFLDDLILELEK